MYPVVILLFFAVVPAMIKRFMLAISRIGGRQVGMMKELLEEVLEEELAIIMDILKKCK